MFANVETLLAHVTGKLDSIQLSRKAVIDLLRSVNTSHFKKALLAMVLVNAVGAICDSVVAVAFRNAVDALALPAFIDPERAYFWFGVMLSLAFGSFISVRALEAIQIPVFPRLSKFLQLHQFDRVLERSPAYITQKDSATLVQAIKSSSSAFLGLVQLVTSDFVKIVTVAITISVVLFQANPMYSLIVVGWLSLYVMIACVMARRCFGLGFAAYVATGKVAGNLGDTILNFETVFNFSKRTHERTRIDVTLAEEEQSTRRLMKYVLVMRIVAGVAAFALLTVMTYSALRDVMMGRESIGFFILAFGTTNVLVMSVFDLSRQMLSMYGNVGTLYGALVEISEVAPLPKRDRDLKRLNVSHGSIRYRDVSFAFPGKSAVFQKFNLEVRPAEKLALVGPSGAGKTTLLRLLLGQLTPDSGLIEIDGQDISKVSLESLHEQIAAVSQVPCLFNRTFRENITYARSDVPYAELIKISKRARLHQMIATRNKGYDDVAGQSGAHLSGGERQRISIARAMLKQHASILLLDEATSALDSNTEVEIQTMLSKIFEGKTVIAIAHRLSTIRQMDRIIYLDHGNVLEEGSHEQLLARGGSYARLWAMQEAHPHLQVVVG